MAQHLELSYTSEHSSDRRVLQLYPSSLTRRVLRCGRGGGQQEGGGHVLQLYPSSFTCRVLRWEGRRTCGVRAGHTLAPSYAGAYPSRPPTPKPEKEELYDLIVCPADYRHGDPHLLVFTLCRHLYLGTLQKCYLFGGCRPEFLDAVLAACRTDQFMPDVRMATTLQTYVFIHTRVR